MALIVAGGAVIGTLYLLTGRETDAALSQQSTIISGNSIGDTGKLVPGRIPEETPNGVAIDAVITNAGGKTLDKTAQQPLPSGALNRVVHDTHASGSVWTYLTDGRGVQRRVYATELDSEGDVLVLSRSMTEARSSLMTTGLLFGGLSLVLLAIGGCLSYWLAGRVLRPVQTIAGIAHSISERDLHRRVEIKAPDDELGELVDTFNAMLARLEASFESLRGFTADASHELRAPLTLMRSELERSLRRQRTAEEYREVLQWLLEDVAHISAVVDQLLVLTRADAGTLTPLRQPVDVADFLYDVSARWKQTAEQKQVTIQVEAPSSGTVGADPGLLRRVLDNLVDNAIRHTPPSTSVRLRAARAEDGWDLEVQDEGPGVPAGFAPKLFTRFARVDSSRTRTEGGAGLGLALSAAIARAHGGRLELMNGSPGATFKLHLPDI